MPRIKINASIPDHGFVISTKGSDIVHVAKLLPEGMSRSLCNRMNKDTEVKQVPEIPKDMKICSICFGTALRNHMVERNV